MDLIPIIPLFLAILNVTAAILIVIGYIFIRRGIRSKHRICMIGALGVSTIFMAFYLYYHSKIGNIPFMGTGIIRPIYFSILASHIILAACLVPMVFITAALAIRGNLIRHRRIARWTLPIWLYVSVTGVVIHILAFHIYTG